MAGNDPKKYLDNDGLLYYNSLIESKYATLTGVASTYATGVSWDGTNNKIVYTKNGSNTDVVTAATLKTAMSLDNVGNFKAVSTVANQGLTDTEKANARANIGAGDSAFDGNFSSLNNVPTTINGYGITDAKIDNGVITLGSATITPLTSHQDISGKADWATTLAGYGITDAKIESGVITLGSATIIPLTSHQDISGKADKSTTVTSVAWDSTNNKITKTINGSTTDVVTASTLKTAMSLNNVGNFKAVSTVANQGLTDTEKANARANLGVDIAGLYHYKGSVATKAALDAMTQSSLTVGDVYNVESDGMNYAYVSWDSTGNKPVWDALGGSFTITSITNAEIDEIVNPTS